MKTSYKILITLFLFLVVIGGSTATYVTLLNPTEADDSPVVIIKGCDEVDGSGKVFDKCGVCGGTNECVGCDGVAKSGKVFDKCGVCEGSDNCVGCDGVPHSGKVKDKCGVCMGTNECVGCDGKADSGKVVDACGECGGDGVKCADPGCDGIPGSGKVLDKCGVCDGPNITKCLEKGDDCTEDGECKNEDQLRCIKITGGDKQCGPFDDEHHCSNDNQCVSNKCGGGGAGLGGNKDWCIESGGWTTPGTACDNGNNCGGELKCIKSKCNLPLQIGEDCTKDEHCQGKRCIKIQGGAEQCGNFDDGHHCSNNNQCVSNKCGGGGAGLGGNKDWCIESGGWRTPGTACDNDNNCNFSSEGLTCSQGECKALACPCENAVFGKKFEVSFMENNDGTGKTACYGLGKKSFVNGGKNGYLDLKKGNLNDEFKYTCVPAGLKLTAYDNDSGDSGGDHGFTNITGPYSGDLGCTGKTGPGGSCRAVPKRGNQNLGQVGKLTSFNITVDPNYNPFDNRLSTGLLVNTELRGCPNNDNNGGCCINDLSHEGAKEFCDSQEDCVGYWRYDHGRTCLTSSINFDVPPRSAMLQDPGRFYEKK
tara:strand:- start:1701 stop:3473 length:1773 start_codon:yes stop_codon:yes gene_type:complete